MVHRLSTATLPFGFGLHTTRGWICFPDPTTGNLRSGPFGRAAMHRIKWDEGFTQKYNVNRLGCRAFSSILSSRAKSRDLHFPWPYVVIPSERSRARLGRSKKMSSATRDFSSVLILSCHPERSRGICIFLGFTLSSRASAATRDLSSAPPCKHTPSKFTETQPESSAPACASVAAPSDPPSTQATPSPGP